MIFFAFALPMPFSSKSSFAVALFKSTKAKRFEKVRNSKNIYFKMIKTPR